MTPLNLGPVKAHAEVETRKTHLKSYQKCLVVLFPTLAFNAKFVALCLNVVGILRDTWLSIQERNHTVVDSVTRNFELRASIECTTLATKVSYRSVQFVVGDMQV